MELVIHFEGSFSSKALNKLLGVKVKTISEFSKIAKYGRYKGKKAPYSLAYIVTKNLSFLNAATLLKLGTIKVDALEIHLTKKKNDSPLILNRIYFNGGTK